MLTLRGGTLLVEPYLGYHFRQFNFGFEIFVHFLHLVMYKI